MTEKRTTKQMAQDIKQQTQEADVLTQQTEKRELIEANRQHETSGYTDDRDLANQLFGRIQMAHGFAKLSTVVSLSDLANIKERKLYKHLSGKKHIGSDNTEVTTVGTWEGFCNALGMSRAKVDEDLINLAAFGEEALDVMNKVGVGYRQMRQLRKLPEKELTIVVNEVEANVGDKDAIVELIEEMTTKFVKEKEALQKKLDEAEANKEANDKFLQAKEEKINDLEKIVSKSLTPDEEKQRHNQIEGELKNELESIVASCAINMDKLNVIMEKIFLYDKGTEELHSQPLNQYEYLLQHLVSVGTQNQLLFDAKNIFAPLMVMFEGATPDKPKQ